MPSPKPIVYSSDDVTAMSVRLKQNSSPESKEDVLTLVHNLLNGRELNDAESGKVARIFNRQITTKNEQAFIVPFYVGFKEQIAKVASVFDEINEQTENLPKELINAIKEFARFIHDYIYTCLIDDGGKLKQWVHQLLEVSDEQINSSNYMQLKVLVMNSYCEKIMEAISAMYTTERSFINYQMMLAISQYLNYLQKGGVDEDCFSQMVLESIRNTRVSFDERYALRHFHHVANELFSESGVGPAIRGEDGSVPEEIEHLKLVMRLCDQQRASMNDIKRTEYAEKLPLLTDYDASLMILAKDRSKFLNEDDVNLYYSHLNQNQVVAVSLLQVLEQDNLFAQHSPEKGQEALSQVIVHVFRINDIDTLLALRQVLSSSYYRVFDDQDVYLDTSRSVESDLRSKIVKAIKLQVAVLLNKQRQLDTSTNWLIPEITDYHPRAVALINEQRETVPVVGNLSSTVTSLYQNVRARVMSTKTARMLSQAGVDANSALVSEIAQLQEKYCLKQHYAQFPRTGEFRLG